MEKEKPNHSFTMLLLEFWIKTNENLKFILGF